MFVTGFFIKTSGKVDIVLQFEIKNRMLLSLFIFSVTYLIWEWMQLFSHSYDLLPQNTFELCPRYFFLSVQIFTSNHSALFNYCSTLCMCNCFSFRFIFIATLKSEKNKHI